jgi:hypothetical protein
MRQSDRAFEFMLSIDLYLIALEAPCLPDDPFSYSAGGLSSRGGIGQVA